MSVYTGKESLSLYKPTLKLVDLYRTLLGNSGLSREGSGCHCTLAIEV